MAKVKGIKRIGCQEVYDIEVKDNHSYIANKIIVHNCMLLPQVLAGFTASESDNFRKGIKQKDSEKFAKWKVRFVSGCKEVSAIDETTALKIWEEINSWSKYGFNKAHSTAYGLIAYMTAWLKVHYPVEFMTALLSCNADDDDKLSSYLIEINRMKIKIEDPDINYSTADFQYRNEHVLFPFTVIKSVGSKAIDNILAVRRKGGKFKTFQDFCDRIEKRTVNVRVVTHLIFANAFSKFGSVNDIYNQFKSSRKLDKTIRELYCNVCKFKYPVNVLEKVANENGMACPECGDTNVVYGLPAIDKKKFNLKFCKRIVYGFFSGDTLKPYLGDFIEADAVLLSDIDEAEDNVRTGGMVKKMKIFKDKNQNEMAFMALTDGTIEKRLVIFSRDWAMMQEKPKAGHVFIFNAKVDGESLILRGRMNRLISKQ